MINDGLFGGIDRLVVKPPFYLVLIPEELLRILNSALVKVAM